MSASPRLYGGDPFAFTEEEWQELCERQQVLESGGLEERGGRLKARMDKALQQGRAAVEGEAYGLFRDLVGPVYRNLVIMDEETKTKPRDEVRESRKLGHDLTAFFVVRVLLESLLQKEKPTEANVAREVMKALILQQRGQKYRAKKPGLFKYALAQIRTGNVRHAAKAFQAAIGRSGMDYSEFDLSDEKRLSYGAKFIHLANESVRLEYVNPETGEVTTQPLFEREVDYLDASFAGGKGGKKTQYLLVLTDAAQQFMERTRDRMITRSPVDPPMLVPPLPWSENDRGGYREARRGEECLVRGVRKNRQDFYDAAVLPEVRDSVDAIQNTAYRVNEQVYEVMLQAEERGYGEGKIPLKDPTPKPPRSQAVLDGDEVALKQWKDEYTDWCAADAQRKARRRAFIRNWKAIGAARAFEAPFWFPMNCDFRGRVYSMTKDFGPQGDDMQKGALEYVRGIAYGENGAWHTALYGADKLDEAPWMDAEDLEAAGGLKKFSRWPKAARVRWIQKNTARIVAVAKDPFESDNKWWLDADKPWQFLAFCFDWTGYAAAYYSGRGEEYVSHLPVNKDGSCNGIQIFSLMWADEIAGRTVNCMPLDIPMDLYQDVTDWMVSRCKALAAEGNQFAIMVLEAGILTRKFCKRPTMTFDS